jgi:hypothetical protein
MTGDVLSLTAHGQKPRAFAKGSSSPLRRSAQVTVRPGAFDLASVVMAPRESQDDDEYAALAEKYGVTFDDEEDEESEI